MILETIVSWFAMSLYTRPSTASACAARKNLLYTSAGPTPPDSTDWRGLRKPAMQSMSVANHRDKRDVILFSCTLCHKIGFSPCGVVPRIRHSAVVSIAPSECIIPRNCFQSFLNSIPRISVNYPNQQILDLR